MITVEDLALCANADVWFKVFDCDGNMLFDGCREELVNALKDKSNSLEFASDDLVEDFWIAEEDTICFHVDV